MKNALAVVLVALLVSACGSDSPTAPTRPQQPTPNITPNAQLTVLVMGHVSNAPLVGVRVTLQPPAGMVPVDPLVKTTDASGRASWGVLAEREYAVQIREQPATLRGMVRGDVQWLSSLPE